MENVFKSTSDICDFSWHTSRWSSFNERKPQSMGASNGVLKSFTGEILGTLILILISFFLPENFPSIILPIASIIAVQQWYKHTQEEFFESHIAQGEETDSWIVAIAIGIAGLIMVLAVILSIIILLPENTS
jgi:hypothetical protein